jgi:Tra1 HEAT repeat ring region
VDRREGENLSQRALSLLKRLLELFPDFQMKLSHFESLGDLQLVKASLRALDVVFQVQMVPFVKSCVSDEGGRTQTLHGALMVALSSRDEMVILSLCDLLKRVAKEFPPDANRIGDVIYFYRGISNGLEKQLSQYQSWKSEQTGTPTLDGHVPASSDSASSGPSSSSSAGGSAGGTSSSTSSTSTGGTSSTRTPVAANMELQLCLTLKVLLTLGQEHPDFVDRFYTTILSILDTKCFEIPRSTMSGAKEAVKILALDYPLRTIRLCLELLALRPKINDIREQLLHSLNELVDRTNHPMLILDVLNLVRRSDHDADFAASVIALQKAELMSLRKSESQSFRSAKGSAGDASSALASARRSQELLQSQSEAEYVFFFKLISSR